MLVQGRLPARMSQQHLFHHAIEFLCICERLHTAEQLLSGYVNAKMCFPWMLSCVEMCHTCCWPALAGITKTTGQSAG